MNGSERQSVCFFLSYFELFQLRREKSVERIKVSEATEDLLAYVKENTKVRRNKYKEYFVRGTDLVYFTFIFYRMSSS